MSVFAEREFLLLSVIIAILGIALGLASQLIHPADPEYYLDYALVGGGAVLLTATLAAWRNRGMMVLLHHLLAGLMALLLLGILLGYDPTARLRPQGRFVSLSEGPMRNKA